MFFTYQTLSTAQLRVFGQTKLAEANGVAGTVEGSEQGKVPSVDMLEMDRLILLLEKYSSSKQS